MLKLKDLSNSTGKFLPGLTQPKYGAHLHDRLIIEAQNKIIEKLGDREILPYILPKLKAVVCKDCKGRGRFIGKFSLKENKKVVCPECNGEGATIEERSVSGKHGLA